MTSLSLTSTHCLFFALWQPTTRPLCALFTENSLCYGMNEQQPMPEGGNINDNNQYDNEIIISELGMT